MIRIEVDRKSYRASIEIPESEIEDIEKYLKEKLNQIDMTIRSSSSIWHSREVRRYGVEFTPNGSILFPSNIVNMIDQLLLLTAVGGSRGITTQEASWVLGIKESTIRSRFTEKKYKAFFRRIEVGRYALSGKGITKIEAIVFGKDIEMKINDSPSTE